MFNNNNNNSNGFNTIGRINSSFNQSSPVRDPNLYKKLKEGKYSFEQTK
jgi:hypothetical protein